MWDNSPAACLAFLVEIGNCLISLSHIDWEGKYQALLNADVKQIVPKESYALQNMNVSLLILYALFIYVLN